MDMPFPITDIMWRQAEPSMAWPAGGHAVTGATPQVVGELLCEAVDLRSTDRVVDIAAGNADATLAAARRFASVTSTASVPGLLQQRRARAAAEGLAIDVRLAEAEALPFTDGAFDVVLSAFGVMFAPDQDRAAAELRRVCDTGGRIGLANWTPDGFIGQLLTLLGRYVPASGPRSPAAWGTVERLRQLFPGVVSIIATPRVFHFRYRSAAHWLQAFRTSYGPVHTSFAALEPGRQQALEDDLLRLLARFDRGGGDGLVVPSEYLEARIHT